MRPWSNIVESAHGLHSFLPECLHRALNRIGGRARLTMSASALRRSCRLRILPLRLLSRSSRICACLRPQSILGSVSVLSPWMSLRAEAQSVTSLR